MPSDPHNLTLLGADMDPVSSLFAADDKILRGIRPAFAGYYTSLLANQTVQSLLGKSLIETEIAQKPLPGFPLTLCHRKIAPVNYCFEWPAVMLKDAALLTLDICLELNSQGWVLKDATPWNVLFDGPRPLFVDFTSIMPQEPDLFWVAYDQFCRLFLFPLTLASQYSGRLSRSLLLDSANGVSDSEFVRYLRPGSSLRMPWLIQRVHFPRAVISLLRKSGQDKELAKYNRNQQLSSAAREAFFKNLRKDVESVSVARSQSLWSKYYADINIFMHPESFDVKQKTITAMIQQYKPATVTDIGCNQGGYSIIAARSGARLTAFDTDEDSISLLYNLAKEKGLDILPLVMDVLSPSPQCGWRAVQYPAAPARFRSEMALALALTHHLAITQNQTFERIVQTLNDYTEKYLVAEYVPLDDPRSIELLATNRRDMSWYTLDHFIQALKHTFNRVETFPSHPAGRTLCLCIK
jgi:hypothetical protein